MRKAVQSQLGRQVFLFVFPVVFALALVWYRFTQYPMYSWLIMEDGPFEYLQFLGLLSSAVLLALSAFVQRKAKRKLFSTLCLLAGCALAFIAFEEISWGQRLEHLQTPSYFAQNNTQSELTLHNLKTVQPLLAWGYMILGVAAVLAQPMVIVASRLKTLRKRSHLYWVKIAKTFAPSITLAPYFLPVSAIYAILVFYKPFGIILKSGIPVMIWQDQELGETLLAMGVFLHALQILRSTHWKFSWRELREKLPTSLLQPIGARLGLAR